MLKIDEAKSRFEIYKENIEIYKTEKLNESDTRSKLIDTILIDVLGWSESDIQREGKVDSGYYDYTISVPGVQLIIEAKKNYNHFQIPTKHSKAKLSSLYSENKNIIDQIRKYADDKGIQYGLLTNGKQFILAKLLTIDHTNWKLNECLVFDGLSEISDRFIEFYDNLSKFAIVNNGGFKFFLPQKMFESNKIVSNLVDREKELVRNQLSTQLTPKIEKVFGEIFNDEFDNEEFVEYCFVDNSDTKKNREEINKLFGDNAPDLENIVKVNNADSIRKKILKEINDDEINIKNLSSPKPVIIVGTTGAGKTTFINHFVRIGSKDLLKNHLVVYLDLRSFFESNETFEHNNINKEIIEKTKDTFPSLKLHSLEKLIRIYIKEIRQNDEGVWKYLKLNNQNEYQIKLTEFLDNAQKNYKKHFEYICKYLIREHRKRIVVILDNADQFTDKTQKEVFIFAHALNRISYCGIMISLREGYYYKWRTLTPFNAYDSNVYHISAPSYSEILLRRIDFTLRSLEFEKNSFGEKDNGIKFEVPNQRVIEFLTGLRDSIFNVENTDILDFLNYTTYPNIREGLILIKQFLISGHTNVEDYVLRERFKNVDNKNNQIIPLFEFVKSIGLLNKLFYNSEISLIHNLFIPPKNSNDHFIIIYLLKHLNLIFESKGTNNKYEMLDKLVQNFVNFGYPTNTIINSLQILLKFNMIDSENHLNDIDWIELPLDINVGITSKGHYYLNNLLPRFHYLDLCLQDTPIFEKEYFEKLLDVFPSSYVKGKRHLSGRYKSVEVFFEYLKNQELKQPMVMLTSYGKITEHIHTKLKSDLFHISKKV